MPRVIEGFSGSANLCRALFKKWPEQNMGREGLRELIRMLELSLSPDDLCYLCQRFGLGCAPMRTQEMCTYRNITVGAVYKRLNEILSRLKRYPNRIKHFRSLFGIEAE